MPAGGHSSAASKVAIDRAENQECRSRRLGHERNVSAPAYERTAVTRRKGRRVHPGAAPAPAAGAGLRGPIQQVPLHDRAYRTAYPRVEALFTGWMHDRAFGGVSALRTGPICTIVHISRPGPGVAADALWSPALCARRPDPGDQVTHGRPKQRYAASACHGQFAGHETGPTSRSAYQVAALRRCKRCPG